MEMTADRGLAFLKYGYDSAYKSPLLCSIKSGTVIFIFIGYRDVFFKHDINIFFVKTLNQFDVFVDTKIK